LEKTHWRNSVSLFLFKLIYFGKTEREFPMEKIAKLLFGGAVFVGGCIFFAYVLVSSCGFIDPIVMAH